MTPEQHERFDHIKREFFVHPAPDDWPECLARIQAHLAVQVGNVIEWYLRGFNYTSLEKSLSDDLDALQKQFAALARERSKHTEEGSQPDDHSPLVKARDWSLSNVELPFVQESKDLQGALPNIDQDTGGAIRFNHHFIGELHPQGNIIALAAAIVAAFLNENVVVGKVSPSMMTWEKKIVHWMWHMLDRSEREPCDECAGSHLRSGRIVAGGTIANLTAFMIAREKFRSWCAETNHSTTDLRPVILYSAHSHYSIVKAARVVGFVVDDDDVHSEVIGVLGPSYWFMTAQDVRRAIQEARDRGQHVIMVCALAGAPDTGFVDDLDGIADVVAEYNNDPDRRGPPIYFHIDAAMGGPFRLVRTLKWADQQKDGSARDEHLFRGINRGDAITIDGHKYFYCNYPCGGIFVNDEKDFDCLEEKPGYLPPDEPVALKKLAQALDLGEESPLADLEEEGRAHRGLRTLEGSRGIIGIMQLYCTLKAFGPDGLETLLQHTLDMTAVLRSLILATKEEEDGLPKLELITAGPLNQTLFRVVCNWEERTDGSRIEFDNQINQVLPAYAAWTQTSSSQSEELRNKLRELPLVQFYVGSDHLLDKLPKDKQKRKEHIDVFLDYVWRINNEAKALDDGRSGCPSEHKQGVHEWLDSRKNAPQPLQVLKAVITHPYTDEALLRDFVDSIRNAAAKLRDVLEAEERK